MTMEFWVPVFARAQASNAPPELPDLVDHIRSSVVVIRSSSPFNSEILGSGFVVRSGLIATNAHVIRGAHSIRLQGLSSDQERTATAVFIDESSDVAFLSSDLKTGMPLPLASKALPKQGTRILALGHPEGLGFTLSEGIISAVRTPDDEAPRLQLTAATSPGSSGGPIINLRGEVVGIATSQYTVGQNLNFAVPACIIDSLLTEAIAQLDRFRAKPGGVALLADSLADWNRALRIDLLEGTIDGVLLCDLTRLDVYNALGDPDRSLEERTNSAGEPIGARVMYGALGLLFTFNPWSQDASQHCDGLRVYLHDAYEAHVGIVMRASAASLCPPFTAQMTREEVKTFWGERRLLVIDPEDALGAPSETDVAEEARIGLEPSEALRQSNARARHELMLMGTIMNLELIASGDATLFHHSLQVDTETRGDRALRHVSIVTPCAGD
jgi:S1-C subfamily serine protease